MSGSLQEMAHFDQADIDVWFAGNGLYITINGTFQQTVTADLQKWAVYYNKLHIWAQMNGSFAEMSRSLLHILTAYDVKWLSRCFLRKCATHYVTSVPLCANVPHICALGARVCSRRYVTSSHVVESCSSVAWRVAHLRTRQCAVHYVTLRHVIDVTVLSIESCSTVT